MALQHCSARAGQQFEAVVEPAEDLFDRKDLHARRCQLKGQWNSIKPATNFSYQRKIVPR
jgi:hypothetical protein